MLSRASRSAPRAAFLAACLLGVSLWAAKAEARLALRVLVAPGSECADAIELRTRITAHDPDVTVLEAAETRSFALEFGFERSTAHDAGAPGVRGTLRLHGLGDSVPEVRTLSGASCAEVVEALVLVALVLAHAEDEVMAPLAGAPASTPTAGRQQQDAEAIPLLRPAPPPLAPDADRSLAPRVLVGAEAVLATGLLPDWGLGPRVGAAVELRRRASGAVLFSWRGSFAWLLGPERDEPLGIAKFSAFLGQVEACSPRLAAGRLGFEGCGLLQLGRVVETESARSGSTPFARWVALGGLLRVTAALHARLQAELSGALVAPLREAAFDFVADDGSRQRVFAFPSWGGLAALGLSVSFL